MSETKESVCRDIARRQAIGIRKYGSTVDRTIQSKPESLQHAYEEALDLAIYLKRAGNAESSTYGFRYASGTAANAAKLRIKSALPNAVVRVGHHPFGTLA